MKAILFAGGWEGHSPIAFSNWCKELLEKNKNPEDDNALGLLDELSKIESS